MIRLQRFPIDQDQINNITVPAMQRFFQPSALFSVQDIITRHLVPASVIQGLYYNADKGHLARRQA
ncbi:pericentriolar material 1 protein [Acidisoma silvae]|uniref:Uncharacterized protein n=1 Tax=Acidisoma silvae TaxID=2802396 RepID=A0A964E0N0_9PROT|nr:pericentriolar material 1 protein [Acidisoma silvae]MCB8877680.1 hypothetical protein [Acidisoma silvae]